MSKNKAVAAGVSPHLPFLRRFARALVGNQVTGDRLVSAAVKHFARSHADREDTGDIRLKLYQALVDVWCQGGRWQHARKPNGHYVLPPVGDSLLTLAPLARLAFLLVSVENFSPLDAAEVVALSDLDLQRLLDEAGSRASEQLASRILICEDDPAVIAALTLTLQRLGHNDLVFARSRAEAIALVRAAAPQLIIAATGAADAGVGEAAVGEIAEDLLAPVIYLTGEPEQLLTGKGREPTFVIGKPFRTSAVKAMVGQALHFRDQYSAADRA